jgi:chromosome segregation ATPase
MLLKQKLNGRNEAIKDLENKKEKLDSQITFLMTEINSLQQTSQKEKSVLNQQILDLKNAKLTSESELQKKIRELEDNLMSLTNKLKTTDQNRVEERSRAEQLEKKIKNKEQDLANLHEELITLQNQLNIANENIGQQNQRISQKNKELIELTNQLTDKDKLITDLQIEIANLKKPPTLRVNNDTNSKKREGSQRQVGEKDETTEKLKIGKGEEKTNTVYSEEDLKVLIEEHQ